MSLLASRAFATNPAVAAPQLRSARFSKITEGALKVVEERYQHRLNNKEREEIFQMLKLN